MRLADDARKCVVFYGTPEIGTDDGLSPWGTGFLVAAQDNGAVYLVTARHVIQDKLDSPFAVRFNDRRGGSRNFPLDDAQWHFHPSDETVDVAVLEIEIPDWSESLVYPQKSRIMDAEKFASKNIGPGDITYTVGLWKFLPGRKRNKPFVHVGHIGMTPEEERIVVRDWMPGQEGKPVEVEAYLTEGEPLRGASGSPVFVRRSLALGEGLYRDDPNAKSWAYGTVWLLGMMSDAYFERATHEQLGAKDIPRGVNIVVPSMKINEVLNQPKLRERRAAQRVRRADRVRLSRD